MNPIAWQPALERAAMRIMALARVLGLASPDAIERPWRWSAEHPDAFWRRVCGLGGIRASRTAHRVLEGTVNLMAAPTEG